LLSPFVAILLLATIWSTTFVIIRANNSAVARAAAASTRELLGTYDAQVVRALGEIDHTLNLIKFWPKRTAGRTLADLKDKGLLPPDLLFVVSIADRSGVIVDSTRPIGRRNIADQDYFRKQRGSDAFTVGRLPPGPTGDAKLMFSRRLTDSNGAFDGIAIVSVDAAYFVSGYDPSKFGEQGVLSMIGTDGIALIRRTGNAMFSGESIEYADAALNTDVLDKEAPISTNNWDAMRRWTSARELYGFPLAVLAGLSVDEQMAAAHRYARVCDWWAALASASVVALTTLLGRMSWRLQRSGKMFKLMAESTNAIPFTLDLTHGRFTYIGARAVDDSHIPKPEWKRPGALDVVIPRDTNPEIRQYFDECASGPFEFVAALHQRNDRLTEVRWTGTCETRRGAKTLRGLMLDITELQRLGRELAAAQKLESEGRLAAGIAQAEHRAAEERVRVENEVKMRSSKLEAVGTLAAGIAHDFNNILAAIVGFAELTADELPDNSNVKRNVEQILSGSFRARDLVARMLTFARASPVEPTEVQIVAVVEEALALLRASVSASIEMTFDNRLGDVNALVLADPTQIMQIVMNLCINSSHAIENRGTITVGLQPASEVDCAPPELRDGICLTVTDTGSGMTPEVRERLFDPFFTTKAPGEGSGLGLSVVYGIVSGMGGVIKVESSTAAVDSGSQFQLFLPPFIPICRNSGQVARVN